MDILCIFSYISLDFIASWVDSKLTHARSFENKVLSSDAFCALSLHALISGNLLIIMFSPKNSLYFHTEPAFIPFDNFDFIYSACIQVNGGGLNPL